MIDDTASLATGDFVPLLIAESILLIITHVTLPVYAACEARVHDWWDCGRSDDGSECGSHLIVEEKVVNGAMGRTRTTIERETHRIRPTEPESAALLSAQFMRLKVEKHDSPPWAHMAKSTNRSSRPNS